MKRVVILLTSLLLMNYSNLSCYSLDVEDNTPSGDSLKVLSSPDLYNLSTKWADEYNKLSPETKIKIINVSESKAAFRLIENGGIGFVSSEYFTGSESESTWKVVVGRDVFVPIVNSKNPYLSEISQHGVSPEALVSCLNNPSLGNWGTLLKNNQTTKATIYWINDESITKGLAEFLKTDLINSVGIEVKAGKEMISAIENNPYAIGFCNMINILDFNNQKINEKIKLLPIDRNNNGVIDYSEKIYDDFNAFSRGVWIGKYPKTLFSNIYSVSLNAPVNESEIAFMKWVLTDGQKFLYSNGYSELLVTERQTSVDNLHSAGIYATNTTNSKSSLKAVLLIIAALIVTGFLADIAIRSQRRKKSTVNNSSSILNPFLNEDSVIIPAGIYFDKTHTWAFMEQNGVVKVGIDDFLQHITGTITRIKMKNPGEIVKKGEQIVSIIQNGKQLNLYSPVSGTIIGQNKILDSNSSLINSSPYSEGWILKIEPTNWFREIQLMFMAEKQKEYIKKELVRLKDFLAETLRESTELYPQVVLQDGGEINDKVLSNMGPEVWEDFQTKFIDPSRQIWFYEIF